MKFKITYVYQYPEDSKSCISVNKDAIIEADSEEEALDKFRSKYGYKAIIEWGKMNEEAEEEIKNGTLVRIALIKNTYGVIVDSYTDDYSKARYEIQQIGDDTKWCGLTKEEFEVIELEEKVLLKWMKNGKID